MGVEGVNSAGHCLREVRVSTVNSCVCGSRVAKYIISLRHLKGYRLLLFQMSI